MLIGNESHRIRVGIVGKGGAGKTTVTALLAHNLRRRGYPVLVLDGDSTNLGLGDCLGTVAPVPLIDHFGATVFSGGTVSCPVDDPTPLRGARISLARLPSRFHSVTRDGIVYMVAGKAGREGPGSGCDGPASKIVRDLRVFDDSGELPTLVDFKAGMEEVARGVIVTLDRLIAVVDPSATSVRLAADLATAVERVRSGVLPATRHLNQPELVQMAESFFLEPRLAGCWVILNRVPDVRVEEILLERLSAFGLDVVGSIPEHPALARAGLDGQPLVSFLDRPEFQAVGGLADRVETAESVSVSAASA